MLASQSVGRLLPFQLNTFVFLFLTHNRDTLQRYFTSILKFLFLNVFNIHRCYNVSDILSLRILMPLMFCVFEKVTESFSYFTCNWVFLVILSSEILFFRKWHVKKARASLGFNHLIPFFGLWIRWILSIDVIQPFSLNVKLFKLRSGICCAILRLWAVGETQINRTSTNDQMSRSHEFHFGDSFDKWSFY